MVHWKREGTGIPLQWECYVLLQAQLLDLRMVVSYTRDNTCQKVTAMLENYACMSQNYARPQGAPVCPGTGTPTPSDEATVAGSRWHIGIHRPPTR